MCDAKVDKVLASFDSQKSINAFVNFTLLTHFVLYEHAFNSSFVELWAQTKYFSF